MKSISKISALFIEKAREKDEEAMLNLLDLRDNLYAEKQFNNEEKIKKMLAENELCLQAVEQAMDQILFSIKSINAEKNLLRSYGSH